MDLWKILIVDDEQDVHQVTNLTLKRLTFKGKNVELLHAYSEREAQQILSNDSQIALVLLDIVMDEENTGLNLVHFIRSTLCNKIIQIIIRTGHPGHAPIETVIVDYEVNDYQEKSELTNQKLRTSVLTALRAYDSMKTIEDLNDELDDSRYDLFFSLGQIAETRSKETGNHVKRVGEISKVLAIRSGLDERAAELLKMAASMHDVGKMAIQDDILNKPGKLTDDEFEIMKTHSMIGYDMLKSANKKILQSAAIIAKEHHENYDGTGYPIGLAGDEISFVSKIVSIVDVFDALGNKRVYKEPWPLEEILEFMKAQKGKKFDPELIEVFFDNLEEILKIRQIYPD